MILTLLSSTASHLRFFISPLPKGCEEPSPVVLANSAKPKV